MPNIIVSSSVDQFMQSADSAAARSVLGLGDSALKNVGTGAAQVASGNHTHAQLHDAATVSGNGISIDGQQISLDIGTGAAQVASGNHTHAEFDAEFHDAATVSGNGISIDGQQISLDIGTGAAQVASGNHTHAEFHDAATVSGNGVSIFGQQISLDIGTGATQVASGNHTHGNLSNDGKVGSVSGLPLKTSTAGVVDVGAFGTGSGQFAQGNDSRFGKDLIIVTDATAAVTLDASNCYPDYIRCTSASAVTLTLAAGQSAAVGRHWIIRQAAAGVATVSTGDSTPAAITRNGDPSTAGQHTEIAVILVADGVVDIVGGGA